MSSIPRGPNDDDAAEPPTPGTNLPRPSLDQTLVGVAPAVLPDPPDAASHGDEPPEAARPTPADHPKAIIAAPMIAVSGGASSQKLDEPAEPGAVTAPRALSRADANPALQSTTLASDYLQAARDTALRKASVPRPRRPVPPALGEPSAAELHASGDGLPREPTPAATSGSSMAAPRQSMGTQASIAPPLEAADTEGGARAPSPLPPDVGTTSTSARGDAPAQPAIRRFEPVPTVRAPLWEQAPPSVGRPLTLDDGAPGWEPLRAASSPHHADEGQRSRWYRLRWVALAAAVLAALAFAVFGEQLTRPPAGRVKLAETAAIPPTNTEALRAPPPEQTLLANHPASEPPAAPAVADPAAAAASGENAPTPVVAPAGAAPAEPTSKAGVPSKGKKKSVKRSKTKRKRAATAASEPAPAEAK